MLIALNQMVCGDYGHRHCFHPPPQPSLQWPVAVLDIRRDFLLECGVVYTLLVDIYHSIYGLSRNMASDDQTSSAVTVSGHFSNGSRYNHQHGCICVRTSVGGWSYYTSKYFPLIISPFQS
jgi:hypothetical protein